MKTPLEHEELLRDVLAEAEDTRALTLNQGLVALRRARARRRVGQLTLAAASVWVLAILSGSLIYRGPTPPTTRSEPATAAVEPPKRIAGTPIRIISDEELLSLFQGRPVALLGEPGQQRLVLLDEPTSNR